MEHTEEAVASMVKVTGCRGRRWRPGCRWPADEAVGAVEVKVMVWEPLATAKVCFTWVAAL